MTAYSPSLVGPPQFSGVPEGRARYTPRMPATWSKLWAHYVFSTKRREHVLSPDICTRLYPFLGGITREFKCTSVQIGGISDHVHMLVLMRPDVAPSFLMQKVKGRSSTWMHETFPELSRFSWQVGYGAFSVSESMVEKVKQYIQNQEAHHRRDDSRTEYLRLLSSHGLDLGDEGEIE